MTNNNWIEELKNCMYGDDIDFMISVQDGSVTYPKSYQLRAKIENLLTKKDQEHKSELEMIREVFWETYNKNSDYYSESTEKGEMDNSNEAAYTTAVLNQIIKGLRDKGIELEKYEIQKDKE